MKKNYIPVILVLILSIGIIGLFTGSSVFAHGTVGQSNPVSGGGSQILAHMPIGQEFTPSQSTLVAVDIAFRGTSEVGTDTITMNIRKGTITSPVLATTSQTVASCPFIPPFTCIVHFDFPTPLMVTPWDTYVIELRATSQIHAWQSDFGVGDYPGGAAILQGVVFPEQDFGFQTYSQALIEVPIDIKPGSDPNAINPKSRGNIPVAILSEPDFDAPGQVDKTALTFGQTGDEPSLAFCSPSPEDVNDDSLADLVCHFNTQDTGFQAGDSQGILRGKTVNGTPLEGRDSVKIVN